MKKWLKICAAALAFVGVVFYASGSQAFFLKRLLQGPTVLPMPDFPEEAATVGKGVQETVLTAKKLQTATQNTINNTRAALNSVFNFDFKALTDGTQNPGQMEIVSCEVGDISADVYDPDSIEDTVQKLFFTYPAYEKFEKDKYDAYRDKFYEDSIIEIYTASRQLMIYMDEVVVPTMEEARQCLTEGGCGIPAADANSESAYAEAQALESMDNLIMVLQKAVALKAQLRAVQAINQIKPRPFTEADQKSSEAEEGAQTSLLDERPLVQLAFSSKVSSSEPLAFAQMMPASASSQAADALSAVENAAAGVPADDAQEIVSRDSVFSEAPESEELHPLGTDSTKEKVAELNKIEPIGADVDTAIDAHNTIRSLDGYKNAALEYKEAVARHERAVEALRKSDNAVVTYLSRRYANPEIVWSGRILGKDVASYELRGGISGWTIDAFETAKAAHVTTTSSDDIANPVIDMDAQNIDNPDDIDGVYQKFSGQKTYVTSLSKEEQMEKENREVALIPWQIGAEGAKLLVQEPGKWGTQTKEFPVWTDTKSFYDQYLNGKYANIRSYLKQFSVNDVKALIVAQAGGESKDATETLKQKEFARLDEQLTAQRKTLQNEKAAEEEALKKQISAAQASLQRQYDSLKARLDNASAQYKELTDKISDLRQKAQDDAENSQHETVTHFDSFTNYNTDLGIDVDAGTVAEDPSLEERRAKNEAIAEASRNLEKPDDMRDDINVNKEENKKEANIEDLEKQADTLNGKIDEMKKQLEQLEKQIIRQKLDDQVKFAAVNAKYTKKFADITASALAAKEEIDTKYGKDADSILNSMADKIVAEALAAFNARYPKDKFPNMSYNGPSAGDLMSSLTKSISTALDSLYAQVDARIDLAVTQLQLMGDGLYKAENHAQVVKIHTDMMNDIKAMALTVNNKGMNIAATFYLYAKLLNADISAEGDDFFVGAPAKARDMKAPKQIMTINLPPLREVFHFDEIDFQNVKPYEESRKNSEPFPDDDFLDYGGEIPEIWKWMLKDHAFVETEFQLEPALNKGCTLVTFFRGGYMPCKAINSNIVIDVNEKGGFVRGSSSGAVLTECPALEAKAMNVHHTQRDINVRFSLASDVPSVDCAYSELGTLLNADENNTLFFKQEVYDTYHKIIAEQIKIEANEELSAEENQELAPIEAAPFSTNQFGDFLRYVENEQKESKALEENTQSYEEMIENLKEVLARFGFEPADDFDISTDKDYNLVRDKLDNIKNSKIAEALEKIDDVDVADNDVVEERVNKYKSIISALQKDKDELTMMTAVVVDNNHLDEDLKSTKVNEEVTNTYQEDIKKNAIDKVDLSATPYCANY